MLITMFLFSVAIGCVIGFGVKRHQMNKMTKQMLQLENQKTFITDEMYCELTIRNERGVLTWALLFAYSHHLQFL